MWVSLTEPTAPWRRRHIAHHPGQSNLCYTNAPRTGPHAEQHRRPSAPRTTEAQTGKYITDRSNMARAARHASLMDRSMHIRKLMCDCDWIFFCSGSSLPKFKLRACRLRPPRCLDSNQNRTASRAIASFMCVNPDRGLVFERQSIGFELWPLNG